MQDLGFVSVSNKEIWFRYYPEHQVAAYNVGALLSALFVRINNIVENSIEPEIIKKTVKFLLNHQNSDGSWYYSQIGSESGNWIDGFHTGYIIESLSYVSKYTNLIPQEKMELAIHYYLNNLFTSENIPKYQSNKLYPIEAQNCAQAVQTLANLIINCDRSELKNLLKDVIKIVINELYDTRGYFYFKKEKYFTRKDIFIRWSVTPMILALLYSKSALGQSN